MPTLDVIVNSQKAIEAVKALQKAMLDSNQTTKEYGLSFRHLSELGFTLRENFRTLAEVAHRAFDFVTDVAEVGDQLNILSRRLGVTTEFLSVMRYASDLAGSNIEQFALAMKLADLAFTDFTSTGNKAVEQVINLLGPAFRQAVEDGASLEEKTLLLSKAFRDLNESERILVSKQLFGRAGASEVVVLTQDLEGLEDELRSMGGVISQTSAEMDNEFLDSITKLHYAYEGLKREVIEPFIPVLIDLNEHLKNLIKTSGGSLKEAVAIGVESFGVFTNVAIDLAIAMSAVAQTAQNAYAGLKQVALSGLTGHVGAYLAGGDADKMIADLDQEIKSRQESGERFRSMLLGLHSNVAGAAAAAADIIRKPRIGIEDSGEMGPPQGALEFGPPLPDDVAAALTRAGPRTGSVFAGGKRRSAENLDNIQAIEIVERFTNVLKVQKDTINLTADERERESKIVALQNELIGKQTKLTEEQTAAFRDQIDEIHRLARMKETADLLGDSFGQNITKIIMDFDHLRQTIRDFALEVEKILLTQLVARPLAENASKLLFNAFSFLFPASQPAPAAAGSSPNYQALQEAHGDAWSGGHIMRFARGGVVSGPTFFRTAYGTGLMGEENEEGILPLARDRTGRLGVKSVGAGGGSTVVNFRQTVVTPNSDSFRKSKRMIMQDLTRGIRR